MLVEGKEWRVWFVFHSAASCFSNCTISYFWCLLQVSSHLIWNLYQMYSFQSILDSDFSKSISLCGNSCLVSLGLACEYHIREKGYASVSTPLTLILLLCAHDYCKKHIGQWKKHKAKIHYQLYKWHLVQKQFLVTGQIQLSFLHCKVSIREKIERFKVKQLIIWPFSRCTTIILSCDGDLWFSFHDVLFDSVDEKKSIYIEYCTAVDSGVKLQPSSQILSP